MCSLRWVVGKGTSGLSTAQCTRQRSKANKGSRGSRSVLYAPQLHHAAVGDRLLQAGEELAVRGAIHADGHGPSDPGLVGLQKPPSCTRPTWNVAVVLAPVAQKSAAVVRRDTTAVVRYGVISTNSKMTMSPSCSEFATAWRAATR